MYKIMTICVGNICRSPLAEGLLKKYLADRQDAFDISSAGIGALVDHEAAEHSQQIALANGFDISDHRARQLNTAMTLEADLLLVMESRHLLDILKHTPQARGKVMLLGHWDNFEVPDPYRKSEQHFQDAYHLIDRGVKSWVERV